MTTVHPNDQHQFEVVSFYTEAYAPAAARLLLSLNRHSPMTPVHVVPIEQGTMTWTQACARKASFIHDRMLHTAKPVLWLDADAEVKASLEFFDGLARVGAHFAAYMPMLENVKGGERRFARVASRLLSGTAYFGPMSLGILSHWVLFLKEHPTILDQDGLADVLVNCCGSELDVVADDTIVQLSPRYTYIADLMPGVPDPVIVHHQASRQLRDTLGG